MCMCVCVPVCASACVQVWISVRACTCVHAQVRVGAHMRVVGGVQVCTCVRVRACVRVRVVLESTANPSGRLKLLFSESRALLLWGYRRGTLWHQEGTRAPQALLDQEGHLHQQSVDSHLWPPADVKTSQTDGLKEPLPGQGQAVPRAPPPPPAASTLVSVQPG